MKNFRTLLIIIMGFNALLANAQSILTETDSFYKHGNLFKIIENDSIQVVVSLQEVKQYGTYYKVSLSVTNKTDKRIEFFPENISGEYVYHKKQSKYVKASSIPYESYAKKVKGHISTAEVFYAMGSALQAYSTAPTQSISYRDNSGYSGTVNIHDSASKDKEIRNNSERMKRYSRLKYEFAESEREAYLLRETLFPQSAIWGYILFKYRDCHDFNVSVSINGDIYKFKWKVSDPEKERIYRRSDDIYK